MTTLAKMLSALQVGGTRRVHGCDGLASPGPQVGLRRAVEVTTKEAALLDSFVTTPGGICCVSFKSRQKEGLWQGMSASQVIAGTEDKGTKSVLLLTGCGGLAVGFVGCLNIRQGFVRKVVITVE